jgi:uncharacterized protein (TIGR01777 family)
MAGNILLAGGSGFVGRLIIEKLLRKSYTVTVLTRNAADSSKIFADSVEIIDWNDKQKIIRALEYSASLINLSGANVMGKRWSSPYKNLIRSSRIETTRFLIECLNEADSRTCSFISASAIGYYPRSDSEVFDENSLPGDSFLSQVTKDWEEEVKKASALGIREVRIRMGIVLDRSGGAFKRMILPYKFFVGGPIGSGRQWFSWVHADDVVNLFIESIEDNNISGAVNAVSPNPVTMNEFAKTLGRIMKRPAIFKVPAFVLKIVLGEASIEVLTGAKIYPKRTIELGYKFEFENLSDALENILEKQ